jgi:hypothetical protein
MNAGWQHHRGQITQEEIEALWAYVMASEKTRSGNARSLVNAQNYPRHSRESGNP